MISPTIWSVSSLGQPGQRRIGTHAAGVGSDIVIPDPFEVLRRQQRHHCLAVDDAQHRHLGAVEKRLQQHRVAGVEQRGGVGPRGITVGGHDHALAGGQPVVLHHPRLVLGVFGTEAVQRCIETRGIVDDLAARRGHACGRHHVFGERLGALDPRGGRRRAETRDPGGAHRVRDAEHQRHLGPDDHQVGGGVGGQLGDGLARGDIDGMGLRDRRGAGIARRCDQTVDVGIAPQRHQQSMFTGTGADHQDAHSCQP